MYIFIGFNKDSRESWKIRIYIDVRNVVWIRANVENENHKSCSQE